MTRSRPRTASLSLSQPEESSPSELAHNRAQTTLSYGGAYVSEWPDGKQHDDDWHGINAGECLFDGGAFHTQSFQTAAGTAFAISYNSDISKVNLSNLVVFSVMPKFVPLALCTPLHTEREPDLQQHSLEARHFISSARRYAPLSHERVLLRLAVGSSGL